jgi:hypothetical protein
MGDRTADPPSGPEGEPDRSSGSGPPGTPPTRLPELIPWFEEFCRGLVRLSRPSLSEIRAAVSAVEVALRAGAPKPSNPGARGVDAGPWREALGQLHWLLGIVEHDDHGGNRQALGQYGLLVAESLRGHFLPADPSVPMAAGDPRSRRTTGPSGGSLRAGVGGKLKRPPGPGVPP